VWVLDGLDGVGVHGAAELGWRVEAASPGRGFGAAIAVRRGADDRFEVLIGAPGEGSGAGTVWRMTHADEGG
jgi:hypothetical protein